MFLGHYGVAFAAKRAVPRTSLGIWLFVPWSYLVDRHRVLRSAHEAS
jgi:hypothetical protein